MEALLSRKKTVKHPAYKTIDVDWLAGEIPINWEVIRMKHLFRDVSEKNRENQELLSVTQDRGVVPRSWVENRMVMPSGNLEAFKFIRKGDFAISLRSFEGGLEYCHHDGIISPAYTVLRAKMPLDSIYYKYLFKSTSFISEIQTSVVGIREGKNVSYPLLSYSFLPIPPPEEQTLIARFLDRKTAQIDTAMAQKEKLIELLKERRQILIHNAVTKGLNPNVKMKDSGVEWIGEIPEHWKTVRLKHFARIRSGDFIPNNAVRDDGPYEVYGGNGLMGRTDTYNTDGERIIIGRVGANCGNVRYTNSKKWISDNAMILTLNAGESYKYIMTVLDAANLNTLNASNAQPLITGAKVLNTSVAVPDPEEQERIWRYIENVKDKIECVIEFQQKQIIAIKEYKATLINSAVTGKIKIPDLETMD